MKDSGTSLRNLWYTTNSVPNSGTYATSTQNWFATGGRSGYVWQTSGSNRSNPSNALDIVVTNFSNNDDVFGFCSATCVAKFIGCIASAQPGDDITQAINQIFQSN